MRNGSFVGVSPNASIDDLERLVRGRYQHGVQLTAPAGDERRTRQLRRLWKRLQDQPDMSAHIFGDEDDRWLILFVAPTGTQVVGAYGGPV
jgi:hypothetical protein